MYVRRDIYYRWGCCSINTKRYKEVIDILVSIAAVIATAHLILYILNLPVNRFDTVMYEELIRFTKRSASEETAKGG